MDQNSINQLLNLSISGFSVGHILSAVVTLCVCILAIRLVTRLLNRILNQSKLDARIKQIITAAVRVILYILTAIMVIQQLGINTSSFVALLSVFSLGITLAAEDILGNLAGSVVLISAHPFAIGDIVQSGDQIGVISGMGFYYTKLLNIDGQYVLIPNKELAESRIVNYSTLGRRRVTVKISAAYDAPTNTVKKACYEAVAMTDNILSDPAPSVQLTNYGSNSVEYSVFCWAAPSDFLTVTYALNDHLRTTFAQNQVEMTYDHLNVHIIENH